MGAKADYQRQPRRVEAALRRGGVVVVMNKDHVRNAADAVTTMRCVWQAGLVAELTFRIDEGILREAMSELVGLRADAPPENPMILGVGSVINPREMEAAIEMGFDLIVSPANVMGGYGEGKEFVRLARQAGVFSAPAVFSPTELNYFLERDDGLEPDAIKVFPARAHGPDGLADLLAPFARARHKGKIIMPTGAVDLATGPKYHAAIAKRGFTPVLGMSAPLKQVVDLKSPGDEAVIQEALAAFKEQFQLNG